MNPARGCLIFGAVAVALVLLFSAAYTVQETEQVIITQFGKPVGDPVLQSAFTSRRPSFRP